MWTLSRAATVCMMQQHKATAVVSLLNLGFESWLSSPHNPSGHKGVVACSPKAESQGALGPAWDIPASAAVRARSHIGVPSSLLLASQGSVLWLHTGQGKPGAYSIKQSCCLRPSLALAVRHQLVAGMGGAPRHLFLISSRVRG